MTGDEFWSHELGTPRGYRNALLAVNGKFLYVRTSHFIHALSVADGEEVWSEELPGLLQHIGQPGGLAAAENTLVLGAGAYLYIYRAAQ